MNKKGFLPLLATLNNQESSSSRNPELSPIPAPSRNPELSPIPAPSRSPPVSFWTSSRSPPVSFWASSRNPECQESSLLPQPGVSGIQLPAGVITLPSVPCLYLPWCTPCPGTPCTHSGYTTTPARRVMALVHRGTRQSGPATRSRARCSGPANILLEESRSFIS